MLCISKFFFWIFKDRKAGRSIRDQHCYKSPKSSSAKAQPKRKDPQPSTSTYEDPPQERPGRQPEEAREEDAQEEEPPLPGRESPPPNPPSPQIVTQDSESEGLLNLLNSIVCVCNIYFPKVYC